MNSYKFGVLREQMHVFHKTKKMNEALQDFSSTILYGPTDLLQYEALQLTVLICTLYYYSTVQYCSYSEYTTLYALRCCWWGGYIAILIFRCTTASIAHQSITQITHYASRITQHYFSFLASAVNCVDVRPRACTASYSVGFLIYLYLEFASVVALK